MKLRPIITKEMVIEALNAHNQDKFKAAKSLGITVKVLYCILEDV